MHVNADHSLIASTNRALYSKPDVYHKEWERRRGGKDGGGGCEREDEICSKTDKRSGE